LEEYEALRRERTLECRREAFQGAFEKDLEEYKSQGRVAKPTHLETDEKEEVDLHLDTAEIEQFYAQDEAQE
jgi:hypothetical protein